jgi:hypothetical protein
MNNISRKTNSNVLSIAKTIPSDRPKTNKSSRKHTSSSQNAAAAGILAVGLVLVALSLSHLAQGIELVTGSGPIGSCYYHLGVSFVRES